MTFGFIITRHVNSELTNTYWNHSVSLLRTLYPFIQIIIIDDNSKLDFIKSFHDYKNLTIIQSEYKGRGELLPYIYFLKHKWFDNAVILHDSVFIRKRIAFEKFNFKVLPLWHFKKDTAHLKSTINSLRYLTNNQSIQDKLLNMDMFTTEKWNGCFGAQSYINHDFLKYINEKYNIVNLIHSVKNRDNRQSLERIMGAIFYTEYKVLHKYNSLLGSIFKYCNWGYTYNEYINNKNNKNVVKVWTGR